MSLIKNIANSLNNFKKEKVAYVANIEITLDFENDNIPLCPVEVDTYLPIGIYDYIPDYLFLQEGYKFNVCITNTCVYLTQDIEEQMHLFQVPRKLLSFKEIK